MIRLNVLFLLLIFFSSCSKQLRQDRPNIILIYTDDMNFDDLGIYNAQVLTPNIDTLANQGMIFNRYYASSPVCTPSRYGVLTGRYASHSSSLLERYDVTDPAFLRWNTHIQEADPTIAHLLSNHGYKTGMVGKYHNLDNEPLQTNCSLLDPKSLEGKQCIQANYNVMVDTVRTLSGFDVVDRLYANNLHALALPKELQHHNMEWVLEGALDFIDQNHNDPFFLYMATTIPHGPPPLASMNASSFITTSGYLQNPPETGIDRESIFRRVKDAGLPESAAVYTWLDDAVGEIVEKLKVTGQYENTMIIFASDHSGAFGGRGKMTNYEGGVNTPAFVWWPGRIKPNSQSEALVANIDLGPSILDAAGVVIPSDYIMDGFSAIPLVTGQTDQIRESVFLEITYSRGIVTDRYKFLATRFPKHIQDKITNDNYDLWNQEGLHATSDTLHGISRSRYNAHELYPAYFDQNQLYDLVQDPGEQTNLAEVEEYRSLVDQFTKELSDYLNRFPHSFGEFKSAL